MDNLPEENYSQAFPGDTRPSLPLVGDERALLTAFLDHHRATFELKCAGLTREQLSTPAIAPSDLTLHGILRHLAAVERWWFAIQFAGQDLPMLFYSDDDPDQDFEHLDGDPAQALAVWHAECARSRAITEAASLEATGTEIRTGNPISLRRILIHMLAEYARHNGHADLLRERLDGATGY